MKKVLLLLALAISATCTARADERGNPFMTSYKSAQMGGHPQNWAVQQDSRGVIYVGNGYGVMEFDGTNWRLIRNPNSSFAKSFAKDSTGRIYVGAAAELGYLEPDGKGEMQYVSLIDQLDPADQGFSYVWETIATPEGICFQTWERIFRYSLLPRANGAEGSWQVRIWKPRSAESIFRWAGYVGGTLYVHEQPGGLLRLEGDSLVSVPDGERISALRMRFMLPIPGRPGTFLLGTIGNGLFLYDGTSLTPFRTDADAIMAEGAYDGKVLPDGNFAIGTMVSGLLVINQEGRLLKQLTTENGLLSNNVKNIFIDQQGNIWLALDDGVTMIEYASSLTTFDKIIGMSNDIVRYKGILYISSGNGLFYQDPADWRIKAVAGVPRLQAGAFTIAHGELYLCMQRDIYRIRGDRATAVFLGDNIIQTIQLMLPLSDDSTRFLGGTMGGVVVLRKDRISGQFSMEMPVPGVSEYIYKLVEQSPGVFWIGTFDTGTIRLTIKNHDFTHPVIEHFGPDNGLPQGTVLSFIVAERMVFSTAIGYCRFDEESRRFSLDTLFSQVPLGLNASEAIVVEDGNGNIWACAGKEAVVFLRQPGGAYRMEKSHLARFSADMVNVIYPENNGIAWFGMSNGLIRYEPLEEEGNPMLWTALIRSVQFSTDSVLARGGNNNPAFRTGLVELPYKLNALTFTYAGLWFVKPDANEYQIMLEGYDKEWSAWSHDNKHNYTNLSPGNYTFRVRARNLSGQVSGGDSFGFTVMSPWYSTWWAYISYIVLLLLAVYSVVHFRTRKLRQRSEELEKIVVERTAEIQEQKNNIEQLSRIGKDITSSLSIQNIIKTAYENVNNLMDASVFTIGLHKTEENCIEFPSTIEKGVQLAPFSIPLSDENRLATWCFKNRQDVIINDYGADYGRYISILQAPLAGGNTESIIYLPLWNKEKEIGVISAQSFSKHAYTDYQVNILRNLATYSAIALENADAYRRLAHLLDELKSAQDTLVTQSKLAALGALTAGIAHEIKNPLNFVNNFASLNIELTEELRQELMKGKGDGEGFDWIELEDILNTLSENATKIREHGKRADSIVRSMLQHSRGGSGEKQPTDINAMLEEDINLTYHGMRAQDSSFNIKIETAFDPSVGKIDVIPQDISRVFLNLIGNACYEVHRKKQQVNGNFAPTLTVSTLKLPKQVTICIRDNGGGISPEVREKLFTPFFTTKPAGQGTGLGLSISWDIVVHKHGGKINVETVEGSFTEFQIQLPLTT